MKSAGVLRFLMIVGIVAHCAAHAMSDSELDALFADTSTAPVANTTAMAAGQDQSAGVSGQSQAPVSAAQPVSSASASSVPAGPVPAMAASSQSVSPAVPAGQASGYPPVGQTVSVGVGPQQGQGAAGMPTVAAGSQQVAAQLMTPSAAMMPMQQAQQAQSMPAQPMQSAAMMPVQQAQMQGQAMQAAGTMPVQQAVQAQSMQPGQPTQAMPPAEVPMVIPPEPISDEEAFSQDWASMADAEVSTINESRGNWFYKAKILKEARKLYESLRKKMAEIEPLEDVYTKKRDELDGIIDAFNREYGFQSGEAQAQVDLFTKEIRKIEESQGDLDRDQRALLNELKQKKDDVEAVKKELEQLGKLDAALNNAVSILSAQINKANVFDENAWRYYEGIELTLSDERAEQLQNKIHNALANVGAIAQYLAGDYKNFFDLSFNAVTAHMEKIKQQAANLRQKGVALGKKMADLLAKEEAERVEKARAEAARLKKERDEAQRGWISKAFDPVKALFSWIGRFFKGIFHWFTGLFTSSDKPAQSASAAKPSDSSSAKKKTVATSSVPAQTQPTVLPGLEQPTMPKSPVPSGPVPLTTQPAMPKGMGVIPAGS